MPNPVTVCLQNSKHLHQEDGSGRSSTKQQQVPTAEYYTEKLEKKERTPKPSKDKREKLTEEEKEMRRERKLGRKRDRAEEILQQELKRRRDDEKVQKMLAPNGELMEPPVHREKHHRSSKEISPYQRERSHERSESREKHRRSSENKRR
ncbi:unnamed protein product [Acanthoscelides obtectus]|uniref:Uncharacterized protein n=1 Tax=Acanthoscelides obtectus TaxID=200917 RepID=A0A9P0KIK3_ACAOB|nr:unnamed protein product [Acanthoscelides obtectus]CAK1641749.1 hypothetical protein AOBTE_LOCUS12608 [Acanthoscelides obtectus]